MVANTSGSTVCKARDYKLGAILRRRRMRWLKSGDGLETNARGRDYPILFFDFCFCLFSKILVGGQARLPNLNPSLILYLKIWSSYVKGSRIL